MIRTATLLWRRLSRAFEYRSGVGIIRGLKGGTTVASAGRKTWLVWGGFDAAGACFDGLFTSDAAEDEAALERVRKADPEFELPNIIDLEDDELHLSNWSWMLYVHDTDEGRIQEEIESFEGGIRGYLPA